VTSTPLSASSLPLVRVGKDYCTALSRNKKEPGAFSLHRDLPGDGVYDCTTYGAWGQTSWFLPKNSLFSPHKTSKTAASELCDQAQSCQSCPATCRLLPEWSYPQERPHTTAVTPV
jgi:hypothetical protein